VKVYNKEQSNKNSKKSELNNTNLLLDTEIIKRKRTYLFFKRIIDIVGSVIGLVLCIPVIIIVAILMKIEEPTGPIFFAQTRVGQNGKEFKMFKIRSMCIDAEERLMELLIHNEIEGAMFKMKNDPRITKVGKFIRKTSIDELPQLWNVLKGEMSLIGPRPPLVREFEEYSLYDKQRLLFKPGCTGLWQVSGRSEIGFDEMVELDIEYIEKASLYLDLKILLKTIIVILKPNGAY
jgi:exopolysaccharide biosynthesis polyprenyl glycosylphosphotransferase